MLSKVIKEKLEHRLGREIRYSKDCELLAKEISKACNCRLSGSTIKRLLGFEKGGGNPRLYTLDLISTYLGHGKWEDLLSSLTGQQPTNQSELEHLYVATLEKGSTILIMYAPAREVNLEVLDNGFLRVVASNETLLDGVGTVKLTEIKLHYPLYLEIPGKTFGIWLAQISGVTLIKTTKPST